MVFIEVVLGWIGSVAIQLLLRVLLVGDDLDLTGTSTAPVRFESEKRMKL